MRRVAYINTDIYNPRHYKFKVLKVLTGLLMIGGIGHIMLCRLIIVRM